LAACDAATDQDLDEIVAAGLVLGTPVLWAGASGLAAALARALLGVPSVDLAAPAAPPRASAPLAIVGSHSSAARAQVRELLAGGMQGISLRPGDLLAMAEPDRVRYGADLARASAAAPTVVWLDGEGPGDHAAPPAIARALGELCAAAVAAARVVIAAGGATARAVLVPSGVAALALLGEVEPGAVLSRAVPARAARPRHALHVITKSGSFGDAATLLRLVTAITQPEGTG
jgi:4-hydroxythreonine-4-phosphate dehydrogenase